MHSVWISQRYGCRRVTDSFGSGDSVIGLLIRSLQAPIPDSFKKAKQDEEEEKEKGITSVLHGKY